MVFSPQRDTPYARMDAPRADARTCLHCQLHASRAREFAPGHASSPAMHLVRAPASPCPPALSVTQYSADSYPLLPVPQAKVAQALPMWHLEPTQDTAAPQPQTPPRGAAALSECGSLRHHRAAQPLCASAPPAR